MHESSICRSLLQHVETLAHEQNAASIKRITVRLGPLSGITPWQLEGAYNHTRPGTAAEHAELIIEHAPIRVKCRQCDAESEVTLDNLNCAHCGNHQTTLLSGDEFILVGITV
ncbi:MAG: hydrogenase maturation nickel metallochaperone HypA [Gammaproteobacteria bacterium]